MCGGVLIYPNTEKFWGQILSEDAVCVATNGNTRGDGSAVMGAGIALFVRENFKGVDQKLGDYLQRYGNRVFNLGKWPYQGKKIRLISFPTKHNWQDKSSLDLIIKSTSQLSQLIEKFTCKTVFLPLPGVNNGQLDEKEVYEAIKDIVHPNVHLMIIKRRII